MGPPRWTYGKRHPPSFVDTEDWAIFFPGLATGRNLLTGCMTKVVNLTSPIRIRKFFRRSPCRNRPSTYSYSYYYYYYYSYSYYYYY